MFSDPTFTKVFITRPDPGKSLHPRHKGTTFQLEHLRFHSGFGRGLWLFSAIPLQGIFQTVFSQPAQCGAVASCCVLKISVMNSILNRLSFGRIKIQKLLLLAILVFTFGYSNAQTCGCPEGPNTITLLANTTTNISTLGLPAVIVDKCFRIGYNATLVIDIPKTFTSCHIAELKGASIKVQSSLTISGAQTSLAACEDDAGGIELLTNGALYAEQLIMNVGPSELPVGINAGQGSIVSISGPSVISNCLTGISCLSCGIIATTGGPSIEAQKGVVFSGKPNINITNTNFTVAVGGINGVYTSTTPASFLNINGCAINVGTGSSFTGISGINILTAISAPLVLTGTPQISNNAINMFSSRYGIDVARIQGVNLVGNQIMTNNNVSQGGVFMRSIRITSCPNAKILNNTLNTNVVFPYNVQYHTYGIDVLTSTGWQISNNTISNMGVGTSFTGDCTSVGQFSSNTFDGNQDIGLWIATGSKIGTQSCLSNLWSGTFDEWGARCDGIASLSYFEVTGNTPPDMPNPVNPPLGWFDGTACFKGGGTNNRTAEFKNANLEEFEADKFSLFPNPTQNFVSIEWPTKLLEVDIELRDLAGKLVMQKHLISEDGLSKLDLPDVAAGTYIVRITADGFVQAEKLSILK